jgi:hypothetical protein
LKCELPIINPINVEKLPSGRGAGQRLLPGFFFYFTAWETLGCVSEKGLGKSLKTSTLIREKRRKKFQSFLKKLLHSRKGYYILQRLA